MKEVTAEDVCWIYWRTYHKQTNKINIRKFKNFDKQRADVLKWVCFEHLAKIANQYKINIYEYIPMVCAQYGSKWFGPKVLINPGNLRMWKSKKIEEKNTLALNKICTEFKESIRFIVEYSVSHDLHSFKEYLAYSIYVHEFNIHIASGKLSKYVLCFLRLNDIRKYLDPDVDHQLKEMVIRHSETLKINTAKALHEILNVEFTSVSKIIDANIKRRHDNV